MKTRRPGKQSSSSQAQQSSSESSTSQDMGYTAEELASMAAWGNGAAAQSVSETSQPQTSDWQSEQDESSSEMESGGQEIGDGLAQAAPGGGGGGAGGAEGEGGDEDPAAVLDGAMKGDTASSAPADAGDGGDSSDPGSGAGGNGGAAGGGGGGAAGGGGGAAGGGAGGGADAPATFEAVKGTGTTDMMSKFTGAAASQQAVTFASLGSEIDGFAKEESSQFNASVPDFEATLDGETSMGDSGQVQGPKEDGQLAQGDQTLAQADLGEVEQPQAQDRSADTSTLFSWWSFGEGADTSKNSQAIASTVNSVSTAGGDVNTSPGPTPSIPVTGGSDPQKIADQASEAGSKAAAAAAEQAATLTALPAESRVVPLEMSENFSVTGLTMPALTGTESPVNGIDEFLNSGVGADVVGSFDTMQSPEMQANLAEADAEIQASVTTRDTEQQAEITRATTEQQRLVGEANAEQQQVVSDKRNEIGAQRDDVLARQNAAVTAAQSQLDTERQKKLGEVDARISSDQAKIDQKFAKAKTDADKEVAVGEKKAKAEKDKAKKASEDQSWWDQACDFVSDCIDALTDVISGIFDAVRSAVNTILEGVKAVANGIIDAAVSFINTAIAAFGELAKGLVQNLIGSIFPDLADELCGFIDAGVQWAQEKVTALGEKLKEGIAALVDMVGSVLNKILDVFEAGINLALTLASCIVTGDWEGALIALLEAALQLAGISEDEFYGYVGKAESTVSTIVNDPLGFAGNVIDAVGMGFNQFGDNFGGHFADGLADWLTGSVGGIDFPDTLDAAGMFDVALQVLDVDAGSLEDKAKEHFGEENVERLQAAWGFVEATIEGGLGGLWEHMGEFLDGIADTITDQIVEYVTEKVIIAGIEYVVSLFNPVAALWKACQTVWRVYSFLQEEAAKIYAVVTSVVDSMSDIAMGSLGAAANGIESALASMIPLAIEMVARLIGMGDIDNKVTEAVEGVREWVDTAIDSMFDKISRFIGVGKGADDKKQEEADAAEAAKLEGPSTDAPAIDPTATPVTSPDMPAIAQPGADSIVTSGEDTDHAAAEQKHRQLAASAISSIKSTSLPGGVYTEQRDALQAVAKNERDKIQANLEPGIGASITLSNQGEADVEDGDIDFRVVIAPNDTVVDDAANLRLLEMDPEESWKTPDADKFRAAYTKFSSKLGGGGPEEAKEIWITTMSTLIATNSSARVAALVPEGGKYAELGHDNMKTLMDDLSPIVDAVTPLMTKMAQANSGSEWAFWSGKPAKGVALENSPMSLEGSVLGGLFDGININGSWSIELWGALSRSYATWAAQNFENKTFVGFVGAGSDRDNSIFNKIEQPTFAALCKGEGTVPVEAEVTFYAAIGAEGLESIGDFDFDKTAAHNGKVGTIASGDRSSMVSKAIAENKRRTDDATAAKQAAESGTEAANA